MAGWSPGRTGASRLYRMPLADLEPAARRLWQVVRDQVDATPAAARDAERLRGVLAERRAQSEEFFATAAGQWDRLRVRALRRSHRAAAAARPARSGLDGGRPGLRHRASDPGAGAVRRPGDRGGRLRRDAARRPRPAGRPGRTWRSAAAIWRRCRSTMASWMWPSWCWCCPTSPSPGARVAEAARALRPGGRLLLTDLMPHERAEYRQTMGHQWQGFRRRSWSDWLPQAGLRMVRYRPRAAGAERQGADAVHGGRA